MERRDFLKWLGLTPAIVALPEPSATLPSSLLPPSGAEIPASTPAPGVVMVAFPPPKFCDDAELEAMYHDPEGWAKAEALKMIEEFRANPEAALERGREGLGSVDLEAWHAVPSLRARAVGDDGRFEYP